MIRIEVDQKHIDEIQYFVDKNIDHILYNTKIQGAKKVQEWESFLSAFALQERISGDNPVSTEDHLINFSHLGITNKLIHVVKNMFPDNKVEVSGFFHYPDTGYMSWHTNSDVPCKRLYITYAPEANKSFFRYYKNGEVITDYDDKGLTFRAFDITDKPPYLWHCIGSQTDRISLGFRIK